MAFRIVDDMPIPGSRCNNGGCAGHDKYGIRNLEVGQAIIIDADDDGFIRDKRGYVASHRIAVAARSFGKKNNRTFATRRLPDGRFGIWRTA